MTRTLRLFLLLSFGSFLTIQAHADECPALVNRLRELGSRVTSAEQIAGLAWGKKRAADQRYQDATDAVKAQEAKDEYAVVDPALTQEVERLKMEASKAFWEAEARSRDVSDRRQEVRKAVEDGVND